MAAFRVQATGMWHDPEMAYRVTWQCPACSQCSTGYSAQERTERVVGVCPQEHTSTIDTRNS